MAIPIAAIAAGAGVVKKVFGKHKRPDNRRAIAELRASRPVGYLTPEDVRAAQLARGRQVEGVNAAAGQAGYEIGRRSQARGLAGSPSEERSRARLEQQRLLGIEHAGEGSEEQLYNMRVGREAYQHQNDLSIFTAQVGENAREAARLDAQNGAFWNSLNEFMPTIMSGLNPQAAVLPQTTVTPGPTVVGPPTGPRRGFDPEARPTEF